VTKLNLGSCNSRY